MIRGIGIDIIEIERIAKALERHGEQFRRRLFTPTERQKEAILSPPALAIHYAGRFAAKEAVVKALGTGFHGIDWHDIEILSDPQGKPTVQLAPELVTRFENPILLVTISHSKIHATAFCLWQAPE